MNKYEIYHSSKCPNNGDFDYYIVTLESSQTIQVEEINSALSSMGCLYQETLADNLAKMFSATITVIGFHQGVKITSTRNKIS
jgi:hypothetical protein